MSNANEMRPTHLIEGLDDETKLELLEHLAEELGYDLSEQGEPVNPQTDIIDLITGAISSLDEDLNVLKTQFGEGSELEYSELDQVAENIESVISELLEAHGNLNAVIHSEFDVDDEEDDDEDDEE